MNVVVDGFVVVDVILVAFKTLLVVPVAIASTAAPFVCSHLTV